jgi:DnaK suppressor protein
MHYFTLEQRDSLQRLLEQRASALRAGEADAGELRELEAALRRLHQPEFGVCVDCEADIPYSRLQANPSARRCVACQGRAGRPAA